MTRLRITVFLTFLLRSLHALLPNPYNPPVGCANYGLCDENNYDPSDTTYYTCYPQSCICNDGTYGIYSPGVYVLYIGYLGQTDACQSSYDKCIAIPPACPAHSSCSTMIDNVQCTCSSGWTGANCDQAISTNPCDSTPCQNGGTCTKVSSTAYTCSCGTAAYGENCQSDPTACNATTCLNGGVCVEQLNTGTTCLCPRDTTGANCGTKIQPCSPNPCKNSAICTNSTNGGFDYTCTCQPGWTGENCTLKLWCDPLFNQCEYGSKCNLNADYSGYSCDCLSLYTGKNCDIPNMCESVPCQNGGDCSVISSSFDSTYNCTCQPGYTGAQCQSYIDFCDSVPCQYGGTCKNVRPPAPPYLTCACQPGANGSFCENNPDDCIYQTISGKKYSSCNMTDSKALCVDGLNSFVCVCGPDYTGADCSIPMIVYNATIIIFGPDAAVSDDIINLLKDLLKNPTNIKDMVPFILGLLDDSERMDKSWDYDDMFDWVAYEEKSLDLPRDLLKWNDVTLGNCFTFNHRNSTDAQYLHRMTGKPGSLEALVKINSDEYCPWVDTQAIQVFVHPAEEDIFSESVRYNAQPGGETELFPALTAYTRLGGRYGRCVNDASEVKQYFYSGDYTTDGCIRSCYQQEVRQACGCMDPRYPMEFGVQPCGLTKRSCVETVATSGTDPSTMKGCVCPLPCANRAYTLSWAKTVYTAQQPRCFSASNKTACEILAADSVRVQVILPDFTYQLFAEVPAMTLNQFIGNLGGLLGVLMGISMISFIEIGFLVIAVAVVVCGHKKKA
ncbi:unnamed protein product, partial [Mesorhabditis spiculigera]